jgi:hypothetical protein
MKRKTALTVVPPKQLPAAPMSDASALMKIIDKAASDPTFDVAKLKELLAVREQWAAGEARNAFNVAFTAFKNEAILVVKNRPVTDGPLKGKYYAELFSVVNAVTPLLSKHGLSHSWSIKSDKETIGVTCTLRHALGHSESVTMDGPADTGGAKNAIQARASTVTYLERYTLKAVCGIAEEGEDNDGNGGRDEGKRMDEGKAADHLAAIDAASDELGLFNAFAAAHKEATKLGDAKTLKLFTQHKDARKKALGL